MEPRYNELKILARFPAQGSENLTRYYIDYLNERIANGFFDQNGVVQTAYSYWNGSEVEIWVSRKSVCEKDEERVRYRRGEKYDNFEDFLKAESLQCVNFLDDRNYVRVFTGPIPIQILLFYKTDQLDIELLEAYKQAAIHNRYNRNDNLHK